MQPFHYVLPDTQASVVCGLLCLVMTACGGFTTTIQQSKDLASSGVAYSDSIVALIDTSADSVIDLDNDQLVRSRLDPALNPTATLQDFDQALLLELKEFSSLRHANLLVKAYFVNLQALADSDAPTATGAALKDLSGAINAANKTLRESKRDVFTADQQGLFAQAGTLVVKNIQAEQIRLALANDGSIIAEQLVWQEVLVASLSATLKTTYTTKNNSFRNNKVLVPYRDGLNLGDEWKANRKIWIKSAFQVEALDRAREAARHMRAVWEGIVNGDGDAKSVALLLDDINQFAATAAAFNVAEKARGASK